MRRSSAVARLMQIIVILGVTVRVLLIRRIRRLTLVLLARTLIGLLILIGSRVLVTMRQIVWWLLR